MKTILIYDDYGTTVFCVNELYACMMNIYSNKGDFEIKKVKAKDVCEGVLVDDEDKPKVYMFCIGGGFDLGYLKALGDCGCEEIRKYVANGGVYLGICAGAYFAADSIEFDLNGPLEVKGERKLKFFGGKCKGPVNEKFIYNCEDEAIAIELKLETLTHKGNTSYFGYLNGGGAFETSEKKFMHNVDVLAKFKTIDENNGAIVKCKYGKGTCVLTSVHIEFNAKHLNMENKNIRENVACKLTDRDDPYSLLKKILFEL